MSAPARDNTGRRTPGRAGRSARWRGPAFPACGGNVLVRTPAALPAAFSTRRPPSRSRSSAGRTLHSAQSGRTPPFLPASGRPSGPWSSTAPPAPAGYSATNPHGPAPRPVVRSCNQTFSPSSPAHGRSASRRWPASGRRWCTRDSLPSGWGLRRGSGSPRCRPESRPSGRPVPAGRIPWVERRAHGSPALCGIASSGPAGRRRSAVAAPIHSGPAARRGPRL